MYVITASICITPYALHMTSHPLFMTSHHFMTSSPLCLTSHPLSLTSRILYLCNHTHSLMISQPPYVWYHIQYTCDILSTIFMTSYPVCMTTPHCVLLIPHSAYVWHHLHYSDITSTLSHQITVFMMSHTFQAWHHTHCIRHRTHCIFVITTSPLIPSLLLYDIIPTLFETSYALYITLYQLLMSSHYRTYDITATIYETTSSI